MWPCQAAYRAWRLVLISIRAWTAWPCRAPYRAWPLTIASIRAWTMWFCQAPYRTWLLAMISTRAWTMWLCQAPYRAWPLAIVSIRAWTRWLCPAPYRVWHLVDFSTRAWTMWLCQELCRAWPLAGISIRAWTMLLCQTTQPSCLAGIWIRAWLQSDASERGRTRCAIFTRVRAARKKCVASYYIACLVVHAFSLAILTTALWPPLDHCTASSSSLWCKNWLLTAECVLPLSDAASELLLHLPRPVLQWLGGFFLQAFAIPRDWPTCNSRSSGCHSCTRFVLSDNWNHWLLKRIVEFLPMRIEFQ